MATTANVYPIPKFHFSVTWGGSRIGFTECKGVDFVYDVIEYREGSSADYSKIKMPGMVKYSNITLMRGVVQGDSDFLKWVTATVMNVPDRRNLKVALLNDTGDPVYTFLIVNAWPVSYKFADLNSTSNEVSIESLELAHEQTKLL